VVKSVDGETPIAADQIASGGTWLDLGEFTFDAEHRPTIVLTGTNGFLRASAMRFTDTSATGLPTAPEPGFAAQEIAPDAPITGTGTAEGNAVVVTGADGTVLGEGTVGDDLEWDAVGAAPFTPGVYTDAVVTETDADGWIGTATATVTVVADATELDLVAVATTRCVGSKAMVSLTVKNGEEVPVDLELETPYSSKSFAGVAPGKNAYHSSTTRLKDLPAGHATVTATAEVDGTPVSTILSVPYDGRSCG